MSTNRKFAHEMVAEVAKGMAGAWYEEAAHDNEFFAFYPSQHAFIKREWHRFVPAAKAQMSVMLSSSGVPEQQKELIFDALVKHASLPGNINKQVAAKLIAGGDVPSMKVH